jgi:20S proteasome alpha/beta subunit
LTVVIGAKCSDGIVMVADKKISTISGKELKFEGKMFGDLAHVLIEYAGNVNMFGIFRRYIVGDVMIRRSGNAYTSENLINELSKAVKDFNELRCQLYPEFDVIIGKHERENSKLYYIDSRGKSTEVNYKAVGSGEKLPTNHAHH